MSLSKIRDFLWRFIEAYLHVKPPKHWGEVIHRLSVFTGYINNISLKSMCFLCPISVIQNFALVMEQHGVSIQKNVAFTPRWLSK